MGMKKYQYFQIMLYERELLNSERAIKKLVKNNIMLSIDNHRLNSENQRIKEKLGLMELKEKGFITTRSRVSKLEVKDKDTWYRSVGYIN
jgi:regulator of replication initiation timing